MTSHSDSKWSFHTSPFRVEESVSISFQPLVTLLLRAKSIRQNVYISKGCGNQWFQQTVTNRNKPSWTSDVLVPSVHISRWLKSNVFVPGFTWIHLDSPGFTWILLLAFPLPSLPLFGNVIKDVRTKYVVMGSPPSLLSLRSRPCMSHDVAFWGRRLPHDTVEDTDLPVLQAMKKIQNLLKSAEVWFRKIPFEEVSWTWLLKRSFQPGPCRQAWSRLARDLGSHGPIVFWDLKVVKGKGLKQLCNACNAARFPLSYSSSLRCLRNWDLPPKRKCKASWSLRCQHQNARV